MAERLECYGTYAKDTRCEDCADFLACRLWTGKLKSRASGGSVDSKSAKPSRARSIRALCWECNGGVSYRADCGDPACPLYVWRKYNTQEPNLWWMAPVEAWSKLHAKVRGYALRLIDKTFSEQTEESDTQETTSVPDKQPGKRRGRLRLRRRK
jgi:hypothetical protein